MNKIKFLIALYFGKILALLARLVSKERGTNISGAYALKVNKNFIKSFTGIDYNKTIFITGTNGKSTTNNIIVHTLKNAGKIVTSNLEGANLISGIATALIKNSKLNGKLKTEYLCFEVDERSFARIYEFIPAKHICITNLQKDQVQRNGEPDFIYQKLKAIINKDMILYLNNEEPRVKSFEDLGCQVIYYGIDKNEKSFVKNDFYDVSLPCPKCNDKIKFNYYNIDNVGNFECSNCDFKSNDNIDYFAKNIDYANNTFECLGTQYSISYNEPFFIYNFVLCVALCKNLGLSENDIIASFKMFKNISGRLETLQYKSKEIKYIRMKQENPETFQNALDYISRDNSPKIFILGLEELKDFHPYYTNTFYTFDCNLDKLIDSNIQRYICFSEAVAYDSANRLIYAGIDKNQISILPTDSDEAILKELDKYNIDNVYLITWLKKYYELDKYIKRNSKRGGL